LSRRRRSIRYPFWLAVAAVIGVCAGYVFVLPFWQAWNDPLIAPSDLYAPRAIDALVFLWSFWIGSSIGSFLNVVAWRMPRGESINGRSHCPRCMAQLRARDNLPVFGWLALGGRCYRCRLPISVRYPIVEAAVGFTIAAVCVAELYQFSLPRQTVHAHPGPLRAPVVDFEILCTMVYHVMALSVAWACGLIRLDGKRLPGRLVTFAMTVTVFPMIIYPPLMVVPWQMTVASNWQPQALYVDAVLRVATALAAATVLGRYLAKAFCPAADPKLDPLGQATARLIDLIVMLSIPALVVGWQAVIAVVVIASLLGAALRPCLRPQREAFSRFGIALPLALTFQLVLWRHLHAPDPSSLQPVGTWLWPSDGGLPWVWLGWTGIVLLIPLWLREAQPTSLAIPVPAAGPNLEDSDATSSRSPDPSAD
jgi:leader peptidase (prepilin peptidase)/N-methyltransferase